MAGKNPAVTTVFGIYYPLYNPTAFWVSRFLIFFIRAAVGFFWFFLHPQLKEGKHQPKKRNKAQLAQAVMPVSNFWVGVAPKCRDNGGQEEMFSDFSGVGSPSNAMASK